MAYDYARHGKFGMDGEYKVITWCCDNYDVELSSNRENVEDDIDVYVDGEPVSIKTMGDNWEAFGIEVEVLYQEPTYTLPAVWVPSLLTTSKANYTLLLWRGSIWKIQTKQLDPDTCDYERKLSWKTRERQVANGHPHIDALNYYWYMSRLVSEGLAKKMYTFYNEDTTKDYF